MKIVDDHEVKGAEQVTRFVCGALAGVVAAGLFFLKYEPAFSWVLVIGVLFPFGAGLLALIQGDRFWYTLFGAR